MHVQAMSPDAATPDHDAGAVVVGQVLSISGADALAFTQAQVMSDVARLTDGHWQWSGWLNAKGRLVAFFALARVSEQRLLAWLPAGGADALRERLQRFVFRSKVVLAAPDHALAIGTWGDAAAPPALGPADICLELPASETGATADRRLWLFLEPEAGAAVPGPEQIARGQRWRLADLQLGLPYIAAGAGNSEQFVPQWLSLERLSAFSVGKGCYPGQEIVARMHFLGQSKRSAARIQGSGPPPPAMAKVLAGGGDGLGEVVWAQALPDDSGWQALAVLTRGRAAEAAAVADHGSVHVVGP